MPMVTVEACGGVVFRILNNETQVLMIRRRDLWDLPKGKLEAGESHAMCAVREVAEETGSRLPLVVGFLAHTNHSYVESNTRVNKKTTWYAMVFDDRDVQFQPQSVEEITEVQWWPLQDAIKVAAFENLQTVLNIFEKLMVRHQQP